MSVSENVNVPLLHIEGFFLTKAFLFFSVHELHNRKSFASMYHPEVNIKKDPHELIFPIFSLTNQQA